MQIGAVAKQIGLTPDAIRFYERNALLPRPQRTHQRDPESLGAAAQSFAALCAGAPPFGRKAS